MSAVAVLGAGGMLGHKACQLLSDDFEVVGVVRGPTSRYAAFGEIFGDVELIGGIDALGGDALERTLRELAPRAVINCIGIVKQRDEAHDAYLSIALNSLLPHRLARVCGEIGSRLVHVSTDCVFDGARGGYREDDPTDARDLYGRTKALGETGPEEPAAVTLRTSFIGRELFAPTHGLIEWFLAQEGGVVDGFARVIYSGLTSLELVEAIRSVVDGEDDVSGVQHVASAPISKHDLLVLVREIYGADIEIRRAEEPVGDRSLAPGGFESATGYSAPSWGEMIRAMRDDPTPYDELRARTSR